MTINSLRADARFHARQFYGRVHRMFFPKPIPADGAIRLHLGCGGIDQPGFVNIDGIDRPHVHFVQSLTRLNRFRDASVEFIYSSHTLEHFPRTETVAILKEWRRVLVPGGRLCLSVPDFDRILEIYQLTGQCLEDVLPPLFGGQDYPFNFNYTSFNKASLSRVLTDAGFSDVYVWSHGSDELHRFPDWSGRGIDIGGRRVPISLNLEAVR